MKAADSGGAVLFAERDQGRRYVLVVEKAGPCCLPKGRLEPGESERQAALREMWEECGVEAALLPGFRREVSYAVGCGEGRQLLSGQVRSPAAPQRGAVAESLLLAYAQALERLTHGPANRYCGPRKPI